MKKGSQVEIKKGLVTHVNQDEVAQGLFTLLQKTRLIKDDEQLSTQEQVINFLTKKGTRDKTSIDLADTTLSVSYRFGDWRLKRYPNFSARMDARNSIKVKQRELQKIGAPEQTVQSFGSIGDPQWGNTFRGIGFSDSKLEFCLDRTGTYAPFRQELQCFVDQNGGLQWKYAFTLYTPDSLYFWKPNDTMGVNTPEFRHGSWIWENLVLSGSVDRRNKLQFEDVHFGGMISNTGVPNFETVELSNKRVVLRQKRDGYENKTRREYVISTASLRDMFQFITQEDAKINTNPLFKFKLTGDKTYNVSVNRKV